VGAGIARGDDERGVTRVPSAPLPHSSSSPCSHWLFTLLVKVYDMNQMYWHIRIDSFTHVYFERGCELGYACLVGRQPTLRRKHAQGRDAGRKRVEVRDLDRHRTLARISAGRNVAESFGFSQISSGCWRRFRRMGIVRKTRVSSRFHPVRIRLPNWDRFLILV
jgi:hypothetical protein